jgi:hypothetical protein
MAPAPFMVRGGAGAMAVRQVHRGSIHRHPCQRRRQHWLEKVLTERALMRRRASGLRFRRAWQEADALTLD